MINHKNLTSKWPQVALEQVVDFLDNLRKPVTEKFRGKGIYPYYGANGQQGTIGDYIFDEPLVLLAEDGGYFGMPDRTIAYKVEGRCWVNNHAHVLRPKPIIDINFLLRHLERYDVTPFINGTTRAKLTKGAASEIPILLPPLAEQKRIAAILDKAAAIRRKRQEAIKLADELLRSVFLDMFGDPVTNPKGWLTLKIEEVCELVVDCVNRTAPVVDMPTPFKMIRTSNVKNGQVNLNDVKYVTEDIFQRWNRRVMPQKGDVLLTREAPVGEAGIIESDDKVFLGQRLMLYRTNSEKMTPEYLLFSFLEKFLQQQFAKESSGSTVKHLPLPVCRNLQVRVPPLKLQQLFSCFVLKIKSIKFSSQESLSNTDELFNSLVQRAFRGEL